METSGCNFTNSQKKVVLLVLCGILSKSFLCGMVFPMRMHCFVSQLQKYMEHFLIMTPVFGERVRTTF